MIFIFFVDGRRWGWGSRGLIGGNELEWEM
jgi:hypothetical protein